jgi:hypothetical protein
MSSHEGVGSRSGQPAIPTAADERMHSVAPRFGSWVYKDVANARPTFADETI